MMKLFIFISIVMICVSLGACKEDDEIYECQSKGGDWVYQKSGKSHHNIGCIDPKAMIRINS